MSNSGFNFQDIFYQVFCKGFSFVVQYFCLNKGDFESMKCALFSLCFLSGRKLAIPDLLEELFLLLFLLHTCRVKEILKC